MVKIDPTIIRLSKGTMLSDFVREEIVFKNEKQKAVFMTNAKQAGKVVDKICRRLQTSISIIEGFDKKKWMDCFTFTFVPPVGTDVDELATTCVIRIKQVAAVGVGRSKFGEKCIKAAGYGRA